MGKNIDSSASDSYLSSLRLEKLGFVFQSFNLLATMTAYENVELRSVLRYPKYTSTLRSSGIDDHLSLADEK